MCELGSLSYHRDLSLNKRGGMISYNEDCRQFNRTIKEEPKIETKPEVKTEIETNDEFIKTPEPVVEKPQIEAKTPVVSKPQVKKEEKPNTDFSPTSTLIDFDRFPQSEVIDEPKEYEESPVSPSEPQNNTESDYDFLGPYVDVAVGGAGMNNEYGNAYMKGSLFRINQVDGALDALDVINAFTVGEDMDSISILNPNLEFGMLSQATVQGSVVKISNTDGTKTGEILTGGTNAGTINPDGSRGLNLGASGDIIKATISSSSNQADRGTISVGIGVGASGFIGVSDIDNNSSLEFTAGGEGDLGIGVGASFSKEPETMFASAYNYLFGE